MKFTAEQQLCLCHLVRSRSLVLNVILFDDIFTTWLQDRDPREHLRFSVQFDEMLTACLRDDPDDMALFGERGGEPVVGDVDYRVAHVDADVCR